MEASVYIGGAHNWCDVRQLTIHRKKENHYSIEGVLTLDFEHEGVAQNELFMFKTTIELT